MLAQPGVCLNRHLARGDAADKTLGQLAGWHLVQPASQLLQPNAAHRIGRDLPVEQPGTRFGIRDCLRQQLVHIDDIDAAVTHLLDEGVVLLLSLLDPDHIIEEQIVAVVRGEPHVCQARPAHHDFA